MDKDRYVLYSEFCDINDFQKENKEYIHEVLGSVYTRNQLFQVFKNWLADNYMDFKNSLNNNFVDGTFICIADLGMWNGRDCAVGGTNSKELSDCLNFDVCGAVEYYIDKNHNFCCEDKHHDGVNYFTYYSWKKDINGVDTNKLMHNYVYNNDKELLKYLEPLGDAVAKALNFTSLNEFLKDNEKLSVMVEDYDNILKNEFEPSSVKDVLSVLTQLGVDKGQTNPYVIVSNFLCDNIEFKGEINKLTGSERKVYDDLITFCSDTIKEYTKTLNNSHKNPINTQGVVTFSFYGQNLESFENRLINFVEKDMAQEHDVNSVVNDLSGSVIIARDDEINNKEINKKSKNNDYER